MIAEVTVGVPVLGRPDRVRPVLESLAATAAYARLHCLFIASPDDTDEIEALKAAGADYLLANWPAGPGDFARKHNLALARSSTEWYFIGADDIHFHPGWIERCLAAHLETGVCVVGTNDLGNSAVLAGHHSTHSLAHRDYLKCGTIDEPGLLLHEGYRHNFVDNEFVETARARDTYVHAEDAIVEHLHPFWSKGKNDATYRRGQAGFAADRQLYHARRQLWGALAVA